MRYTDYCKHLYTVYDQGRDYLFMVGKSLEFYKVISPPALLGVVSDTRELNYQLLEEFSRLTGAHLFPCEKEVQIALEKILSQLIIEVRRDGGAKSIREIAEFHSSIRDN